jgi:hypothetical protein
VYKQALNQAAILVWAHGMICAERQDNELHHKEYGDPVEQSTDKEMISQELELFAYETINGGGRESDEVVDAEAEDVLADGAVTSGCANDAARNSYRHVTAVGDVGGGHVEQAGHSASYKDRKRETRLLNGSGD